MFPTSNMYRYTLFLLFLLFLLPLSSEAQNYNLVEYRGPASVGTIWLYSGNNWDGDISNTLVKLEANPETITAYSGQANPSPYYAQVVSYSFRSGSGDSYQAFVTSDLWYEYYSFNDGYRLWGNDDPSSTNPNVTSNSGESVIIDGGLNMGSTLAVGQLITSSAPVYNDGHYMGNISCSIQLLEIALVDVPAGKYDNCLHLRFTITNGETQVWDEWWASGVGPVKMQGVSGAGAKRLRELQHFSIGLPLAESLNTPTISIISEKPAWFGQNTITHDGNNAAQSPILASGQVSQMETTLQGPGTISFFWKVSTASNYDSLHFYVDDVEQGTGITGDVDWTFVSIPILASGSHKVKWSFSRNTNVMGSSNCGWVDQVSYEKWVQTAKVKVAGLPDSDYYGAKVAISNNRAIIRGGISKRLLGGYDYAHVSLPEIYDLTTSQRIRHLESMLGSFDGYGLTVALSGNRAAIGSQSNVYVGDITTGDPLYLLDSGLSDSISYYGITVSINDTYALAGCVDDNTNGYGAGAAYLYSLSTGALVKKITPDGAEAYDNFGTSVALGTEYALVSSSKGVFVYNLNTVKQSFVLRPHPDNTYWGSMSVSGHVAVICDGGVGYVYNLKTGNLIRKLNHPDPNIPYGFGPVSTDGHLVLFGTGGEKGPSGAECGVAYLFNLIDGTFLTKLYSHDQSENQSFGASVAVSGDWAVVGAPRDTVQYNNYSYYDAGGAYFFNLSGVTGNIAYDLDIDFISDEWENAYFESLNRDGSGDYDQDGFPDLQEFQTGTNPIDPLSHFTASLNADMKLQYGPVIIGRKYRYWWSSQLGGASWNEILLPPSTEGTGEFVQLPSMDSSPFSGQIQDQLFFKVTAE
ncbi:MAG: hypothetical protein SFY80_11995 [Verrucomicrobiota bacterium]|nr:hypothetical protein [Verrucomicrobiota bacterium]